MRHRVEHRQEDCQIQDSNYNFVVNGTKAALEVNGIKTEAILDKWEFI